MFLIDPETVMQSSLGEERVQRPLHQRANALVRATVLRVYPVGHTDNARRQTVVDLQPISGAWPLLYGVPIAPGFAHQETDLPAARSANRQPYAPKPRNRIAGQWSDPRPGTQVWVQFAEGSLFDPVVVGFANFPGGDGEGETQTVDRFDDDGQPAAQSVTGLESDVVGYPRKTDSYNGVRTEIDNEGSLHIQTSTDREPVFQGDPTVPKSPEPRGNYGVSTRGARQGDVGFTTGRRSDDEPSQGRQFRRSVKASDGTIRDSTEGSAKGSWVARLKSKVGRFFVSARGSDDGRVYVEADGRAYVALSKNAELHGDDVVLDGSTVHLGSKGAGSEIVLWPQLKQILATLWTAIDSHTHTGVSSGSAVTGPPSTPTFTSTWNGSADQCKAADVFADQSNAPSPSYQDEPD